jgi:hypothetical protein
MGKLTAAGTGAQAKVEPFTSAAEEVFEMSTLASTGVAVAMRARAARPAR